MHDAQAIAQSDVPNVARMHDFYLGGKDHLAADRAIAILGKFPEVAQIARANRAFQGRAVAYAAARGITQFVDLGAGLPTEPATHDPAYAICPDARVAYVDHDELVLAHARALLAVDDNIAVVPADLREAGTVLTDPALLYVIDLDQPVCILLVSVLHFLRPRRADITAWFTGLTLTPPGLTDVHHWQPDSPRLPDTPPSSRGRSWPASPSSPPPIWRRSHDRRPSARRRLAGCGALGGRRAAAQPAARLVIVWAAPTRRYSASPLFGHRPAPN